jgi:hypothetical protein
MSIGMKHGTWKHGTWYEAGMSINIMKHMEIKHETWKHGNMNMET